MPAPHTGGLIPGESHPDLTSGHPRPWRCWCCLQVLLPFSAQVGFTVILHLTNRFGVSLSLLLTAGEVSMQEKFPLEMKDLHFVLLYFMLFLLFRS